MGLRNDLDARRAGANRRFLPEDLQVMRRATEDLRNSGILERARKVGDTAPRWTLSSPGEDAVRSADLLRNGPLVLAFFRGVW